MFNNFFSRKSCRLLDNAEKILEPDRPQMTKRRMCLGRWIPKTANTHSEYVTILLFHVNNGYANAPQCYVILTPLVLLSPTSSTSCKKLFHFIRRQ